MGFDPGKPKPGARGELELGFGLTQVCLVQSESMVDLGYGMGWVGY